MNFRNNLQSKSLFSLKGKKSGDLFNLLLYILLQNYKGA
jgi:hypothetical protein